MFKVELYMRGSNNPSGQPDQEYDFVDGVEPSGAFLYIKHNQDVSEYILAGSVKRAVVRRVI